MTTGERTQYPPATFDGVTELRIHGVSGTPPEAMLVDAETMIRDPYPVQVWGDGTAGFYRRASDLGPGKRHVEAYSWGGLTAGSATRAAWLLLLPFMLVNVASWAHPPRRRGRWQPVGLMSGAIRVLALTLTLTLLLSVAFLTMDLVAWQCAPDAGCAEKHWYVRLLADRAPGVRILLGALPLVLTVVGIRWLSKSTSKRYEDCDIGVADAPAQPAAQPAQPDPPPGARDMGNPAFWYGKHPLARLRSLHVTACWATVAGLVAYAASTLADGARRGLGEQLAAAAACLLVPVVVALATPVSGRRHELLAAPPDPSSLRAELKELYCYAVAAGPYAAFALLLAAGWYAVSLPADNPPGPGSLPGLHSAKNALVVAQLAAFGVLLVANLVAVLTRDKKQQVATRSLLLGGFAASLLAAVGTVLAGSFAAGLTIRVADYFGCAGACRRTGERAVAFVLPDVYESTARGFLAATAAALVAGAVVWFGVKRLLVRRALPLVQKEYPGQTDRGRCRAIAKVHATAALTDHGAWPLAFVVVAGSLGAWLLSEIDDAGAGGWMTMAGSWLAGGFALWLVWVGHRAYSSPGFRRTVGILWDLGTFWPRGAHPFAPPCYCERTVPEFAARIEQIRAGSGGTPGSVVVSAHSQGSVIAIATLLRLRRDPRRLALLTYGSPLDRLYARAFPHFFGQPVLEYVRATYWPTRWLNLYRRSDPIGGPVACADRDVPQPPPAADQRLSDPVFQTEAYAFTPPPAYGHSNYFADPEFAGAVTRLAVTVSPG